MDIPLMEYSFKAIPWLIGSMTSIWNSCETKVEKMAKKFETLRARMSAESQARAKAETMRMSAEMPLHELRQALGLSQKELADILHVQQPTIAKLEKRADMYISTLRSHVEAMGGQLEVIARFPDGDVKISNFSHINMSCGG